MKIYSKDPLTGEMKPMGEIPIDPQWLMTDEERSQLTQLAQRIAIRNGLSASVTMTLDYMSIMFTKIDESKKDLDYDQ